MGVRDLSGWVAGILCVSGVNCEIMSGDAMLKSSERERSASARVRL